LPGWPGFEDDAHARDAWAFHRDQLLPGAHPGERPWAYWAYDWGLDEVDDANGDTAFAWPAPITSEQEMVHSLLKRRKLKPTRLNGCVRIGSEIATIEENWRREIGWTVDRTPAMAIDRALPTYGCPPWYYALHAPAIIARQAAPLFLRLRRVRRRLVV
jgi:hypothetical protein